MATANLYFSRVKVKTIPKYRYMIPPNILVANATVVVAMSSPDVTAMLLKLVTIPLCRLFLLHGNWF